MLLDATVVRVLLVPAAMRLLGDANWYLPRFLGWMPKFDFEAPARDFEPVPVPVEVDDR